MAASSVRQIHAILSGALTRAVVWGWISHNPARLASPPSREQDDTQPPAVEDAGLLLRTAAADRQRQSTSTVIGHPEPWWRPISRSPADQPRRGRPLAKVLDRWVRSCHEPPDTGTAGWAQPA